MYPTITGHGLSLGNMLGSVPNYQRDLAVGLAACPQKSYKVSYGLVQDWGTEADKDMPPHETQFLSDLPCRYSFP